MTERKALSIELKADQEGAFRARFATLGVVDHDGDVTLKGAFEVGAPVRVAQFGHNWGDYVIGDGVLGADEKAAWADAEFYLDTTRGLDTYRSVKRLSAKGLQEFSYGFDVLEASTDKAELEQYPGAGRILKKMQVHEISPVMLGAGIDTGIEFIKSFNGVSLNDQRAMARAANAALVDRYKALAAELRKEGRAISSARRERISGDEAALRDFAKGQLSIADDLKALLEETNPDATGKAALQQLHMEFMRTSRQLGLAN